MLPLPAHGNLSRVIIFHRPGEKGIELTELGQCPALCEGAVWIDVCEPTREEERDLEATLGLNVPTREEMQAIELSSRLYREGDILYMTGTVLTKAHVERPQSTAITFILMRDRLVTLRYESPLSFQAFRARRDAHPERYLTANDNLVGLIDAVVERVADILENVGVSLDRISEEIFEANRKSGIPGKVGPIDFVAILRRIGLNSDLVSRVRESMVSFTRLMTFFREAQKEGQGGTARESLAHLKTVVADLSSLSDHATFLAGKVGFLLDATLGLINNEQNRIIKIVSLAAVIFLPPTLVASVYGMNFAHMPELAWAAGYPFALLLMVISAVLPYLFFKRKGWL